ncbi:MAG: EutN/CcmL family microcompartment protein [Companilactobacillus sp.]|jgi:microcompartment protein CcmK/EutM|nr:EutN/CcmL family microcompartment protein [Companilactobacillus sp.]MCH4051176.1 EutN/CcmL family microcompartment protein [Companilactobacillus sp.]MCH4076588.1 EutN/CcmL family microcompartment protein [Companilactobacillus sp.]MCH4125163.1 EutN/CcmL family microcompartment protein [Companilactobacillus sp.]MCH4131703.1 EutN/CcmL family microcompartment protein [Companilactobacillus sp.]
MYMGIVVGSVVSTQKAHSLVGKKLMIVQPIDSAKNPVRCEEVSIDTVGAGIGEAVLLVRGAAARISDTKNGPVRNEASDSAIVGIIDRFDK